MWHTGDKHKSQLGLMKCTALMALGARVAEQGLNACSLLTSSMSDLLTDWMTGWLTDWLGTWAEMCAQMMQVIGIRGQMLQYVIQLFCRWGLQCQYHWWNWLNASFWRGSAERALATVDKFSVQMSCAVVFVSSVLTFVRSHWKAVH